MTLDRYNLPIKVFYGNMLKIGIKFRVAEGQLKVKDTQKIMTPVLQEEISKRAEHLIALLTPAPPEEMASHFGRLLTLEELKQALNTAAFLREKVDATPCNGGWILTTAKYKVPA